MAVKALVECADVDYDFVYEAHVATAIGNGLYHWGPEAHAYIAMRAGVELSEDGRGYQLRSPPPAPGPAAARGVGQLIVDSCHLNPGGVAEVCD